MPPASSAGGRYCSNESPEMKGGRPGSAPEAAGAILYRASSDFSSRLLAKPVSAWGGGRASGGETALPELERAPGTPICGQGLKPATPSLRPLSARALFPAKGALCVREMGRGVGNVERALNPRSSLKGPGVGGGGPGCREPRPTPRASPAGVPRGLSTGFCRLCHGKFSSRSLRNAFGKAPVLSEDTEKQRRLDQIFFTDFQRLVGVAVQQDPSLPPFVCKKCHAQFYKCRSILKAFIQKVNVSPAGHPKPRGKNSLAQPSLPVASAGEGEAPCLDLITSSPQCLHQLVRWSHDHAENCPMAPSLQSVLSSKYCGIIRAVWGCEEGHNYIMSTDSDCSTLLVDSALAVQWELKKDTPQHVTGNGVASDNSGVAIPSLQPQHSATRVVAGQQPADSGTTLPASSAENLVPESRGLPSLQDPLQEHLLQATCLRSGSPGRPSEKPTLSAASDERVKDAFSDLSEGESSNEDENHKAAQSSDDSFEPYPEKRVSSNRKAESKDANVEEQKARKKPGPKPGWKKKIKCEREELPNIYKCPYQGCTAVYRGADGMKKHIKEHHEEVRERPCPHPGCNKVFMIDRYLQRHVKLIHTEVRNYICDECGQTFKQRKHLSVHQMRHSGAKPLQCEICGFQCRQRASLKYHMTKHKAEAELEFACDQCGKRFEKAHNLNVHMSMVHPLTQTQEKAKGVEPEPRALLDTVEGQPIKVERSAQQEPT